jgi:hypothetical protein
MVRATGQKGTELSHYPAPHQNFKATRSCKTALPPDLGVKQAKGLIQDVFLLVRTGFKAYTCAVPPNGCTPAAQIFLAEDFCWNVPKKLNSAWPVAAVRHRAVGQTGVENDKGSRGARNPRGSNAHGFILLCCEVVPAITHTRGSQTISIRMRVNSNPKIAKHTTAPHISRRPLDGYKAKIWGRVALPTCR